MINRVVFHLRFRSITGPVVIETTNSNTEKYVVVIVGRKKNNADWHETS